MATSDVARDYARALFQLATIADSVDAADAGLGELVKAVRGHVDLRTVLTDASMAPEAKRAVLQELFGENVTPEVLGIVTIMVERGLTGALTDLARDFGEIAEAERGVIVAEVITAIPLDDALRASLTDKLVASLGRPVSLRELVDEKILGGIVIKVAGRVLDGSVASQLDGVRRALVTAQGGGA